MSAQYTGGMMRNPTCKPKVDATNTEAVWKERVNTGKYFVKHDEGTTTADEIGIDFMVADDKIAMGRAIGYTGTGDKFRVTVETVGVRGKTIGGASGAFASTDFFDQMKADANGKLIVDNAQTGGNIILVGGTKDTPYVAWQWPQV